MCKDFTEEASIIYNDKKFKYMCVKPKSMTKVSVPHVYRTGKPLSLINQLKYLGSNLQTYWYDDGDIKLCTSGVILLN